LQTHSQCGAMLFSQAFTPNAVQCSSHRPSLALRCNALLTGLHDGSVAVVDTSRPSGEEISWRSAPESSHSEPVVQVRWFSVFWFVCCLVVDWLVCECFKLVVLLLTGLLVAWFVGCFMCCCLLLLFCFPSHVSSHASFREPHSSARFTHQRSHPFPRLFCCAARSRTGTAGSVGLGGRGRCPSQPSDRCITRACQHCWRRTSSQLDAPFGFRPRSKRWRRRECCCCGCQCRQLGGCWGWRCWASDSSRPSRCAWVRHTSQSEGKVSPESSGVLATHTNTHTRCDAHLHTPFTLIRTVAVRRQGQSRVT
jgi:hypothetical protein